MEFKKLLLELKSFNLPNDKFAVGGSGSLAVRGIREANDLDLVVSDGLWEELLEKYSPVKDDDIGKAGINKIVLSKNIEVWGKFEGLFSAAEQIKTADEIEGIKYVNLEIIKIIKTQYGRIEDQRDVMLIEKYLKEK